MKLETKRNLAARTLKTGKNRIIFNSSRLSEIKEAITKQDIRDLKESGAISIKEIKGRRTKQKRKTRRRYGSIKKKVNTKKREYVALTRKLRAYLKTLKENKKISQQVFLKLRKEIKTSSFRSLSHLKEYLKEIREPQRESPQRKRGRSSAAASTRGRANRTFSPQQERIKARGSKQ